MLNRYVMTFIVWPILFAAVQAQVKKVPEKPVDTSKEAIQDSVDFTIKHPAHTIHLRPVDSVTGKPLVDHTHSSRRAWLLSAVIPGTGQIYNKRYWKLPIVYGGFVALGLAINFYARLYQQTREVYNAVSLNPATTSIDPQYIGVPLDQIGTIRDFYRRNRDLYIIGAVVLWGANAIDAYVDAELKGFDVSNKLTMKAYPDIGPIVGAGEKNKLPYFGVKLTFNLH